MVSKIFIICVISITLLLLSTIISSTSITTESLQSQIKSQPQDDINQYLNLLQEQLHAFQSEIHFHVPTDGSFKIVKHRVIKDNLIGQVVRGHVFTIAGAASSYHTYIAPQGCPGAAATSTTSKHNNCVIATNAGFFNMQTSACLGNIVTDGHIIQSVSAKVGGFGITHDNRMAIGYANKTVIDSKMFKQFVNGRGWIVKKGVNNVDHAEKAEGLGQAFLDLLAPRLAVGWDKNGHFMLFVIDGIEKEKQGLDLYTFADLMINEGVVEAVNLDGGGSVTLVWNGVICDSSGMHQAECEHMDIYTTLFGQIQNEQSNPYERPVTTVVCLK